MKVRYSLVILLFIVAACSNPKIRLVDPSERGEVTDSEETVRIKEEYRVQDVRPEMLSRLFYIPPVKKVEVKKEAEVVFTPTVRARDYRVVIDWKVDGVRFVKLKNTRTGDEYTVKEGDTGGPVVLLSRDLLTYRFRIYGEEVEIKK